MQFIERHFQPLCRPKEPTQKGCLNLIKHPFDDV